MNRPADTLEPANEPAEPAASLADQDAFVRLSRKFFTHYLWEEDRAYSRAEAWLDFLQTAAFAPHKRIIAGTVIEVPRGSLAASVRWLSGRWKWSNTKVCLFLDLLEKDGMITRQKRRDISVISLCKYGVYNPLRQRENDAGTTLGRHRDDEREEGKDRREDQREVRDSSPGQPGKPARRDVLTDEAFLHEIRQHYPHLHVDTEIGKMRAWLLTPRGRGKKLTRQRILNWLNRCDAPLALPDSTPKPSGEASAYTWG